MLTTIEGTYENGQIIHWSEMPPAQKKAKVLVTFLKEDMATRKPRKAGSLAGRGAIPDDFNEPLDDLKDYM